MGGGAAGGERGFVNFIPFCACSCGARYLVREDMPEAGRSSAERCGWMLVRVVEGSGRLWHCPPCVAALAEDVGRMLLGMAGCKLEAPP